MVSEGYESIMAADRDGIVSKVGGRLVTVLSTREAESEWEVEAGYKRPQVQSSVTHFRSGIIS